MSGLVPTNVTVTQTEFPPTSCVNPFDANIYAIVAAVAAVSGFISLLASCLVIFIIILFKKWKFFSQRLILYLAITAALKSSSVVLQRVDYQNQTSAIYSNFCVFAGFLSLLTSWMILNAVVVITVSLFLIAFVNKQPEKFEIVFLLLIFVFPFTFTWIPFIKLAYGKAGVWCWIRQTDEVTCKSFKFGLALQLVLWYIPLYVIMFVLIVLYVMVQVKLHRTRQVWTGRFDPQAENTREQMAQEIHPLIVYPLIFFLLDIPPFINRIHWLADPNNPEPALWFISAALFPLQGGIIAVAFSLDPETRRRLTLANFRAAFSEFCTSKKVKEYPITHLSSEGRLEEELLSEEDKQQELTTHPIETSVP